MQLRSHPCGNDYKADNRGLFSRVRHKAQTGLEAAGYLHYYSFNVSRLVFHASVTLLILIRALAAQDAPIRVQSKLVQVPVSVTAKDGRNVEGLAARDFRVLDDGVERTITADVFDGGAARISLAIVVQASAVPATALPEIRRLGSMIEPLVIGRRGEAAVMTFDREVKWLQDFTRDPREIQHAFRSIRNGSPLEAHLFDAVAKAADSLRGREGRKVLLVISDGHDRGSETASDDAVEAVERAGIEVFGARYSPDSPKQKGRGIVSELADATGGWDYPYRKERGIERAIENLGVEVHSQYILSFPEPGGDDGPHQITVAIQNRADLHVRARQAYWTGQAAPNP